MISRSWGPGQPVSGDTDAPSGEGEPVGGRSGDSASPAGIGTLRVVVGMYSLLIAVVLLVVVVVRWQADGVLLLATLFAAVFAWAVGAYHRSFWVD